MASKRQRRVKAKRKDQNIALKKVAQIIREASFKSLPADIRKSAFDSASRDNETINSEADTPGQVGNGFIVGADLKDIYRNCFEEDLNWASEILMRRGGD
jgi:hypothetical protein